jgi:hypothetical protein
MTWTIAILLSVLGAVDIAAGYYPLSCIPITLFKIWVKLPRLSGIPRASKWIGDQWWLYRYGRVCFYCKASPVSCWCGENNRALCGECREQFGV